MNGVRSYASIIYPDDTKVVENTIDDGVKKKRPFTINYRIVRADGGVRHVYERGQAVFDDHGEVAWLDGAVFDITAQKLAEDALAAEMDRRMEFSKQLEEANTQLKRLIAIDGLTGISNRRYFDEFLEKEWQRNMRDNKPISLIMGDIDFFKNYNDRYGYQAGDDCLKQVAAILNNMAQRPGDLAARYGG